MNGGRSAELVSGFLVENRLVKEAILSSRENRHKKEIQVPQLRVLEPADLLGQLKVSWAAENQGKLFSFNRCVSRQRIGRNKG
jgi:hypothetical protein